MVHLARKKIGLLGGLTRRTGNKEAEQDSGGGCNRKIRASHQGTLGSYRTNERAEGEAISQADG